MWHAIESSAAVLLLSLAALSLAASTGSAKAAGMQRTITMVEVEPKGGDPIRSHSQAPTFPRARVTNSRPECQGTLGGVDLPLGPQPDHCQSGR